MMQRLDLSEGTAAMEDKVSIIVPVYNLRDYLPRCLDSILSQIHRNIEIIAVNDGSTDGSDAVLDQYVQRYPDVLRVIHKKNGGVTSARLRGIQEAAGDWIGFVDGDDEIEPDMFERLLRNAQQYGADISHCGYQMVFSDGRVNYFHNTGLLLEHDRITALRELLSGAIIEPGLCNKLFRKVLFRSLLNEGKMKTDIRINEDLLMNYYLFSEADKSIFEDWCPYHYIVRSGSASRSKLNPHKIYDPIWVKEIIRREAPGALRQDAQIAYLNSCMTVYHTLTTSGSGYQEDIRKVRQLLRREKDTFYQLGKKRALMANLIAAAPAVYKPIYWFYHRFLQKNAYV